MPPDCAVGRSWVPLGGSLRQHPGHRSRYSQEFSPAGRISVSSRIDWIAVKKSPGRCLQRSTGIFMPLLLSPCPDRCRRWLICSPKPALARDPIPGSCFQLYCLTPLVIRRFAGGVGDSTRRAGRRKRGNLLATCLTPLVRPPARSPEHRRDLRLRPSRPRCFRVSPPARGAFFSGEGGGRQSGVRL